MSHVFHQLYYHFTWATKDREPLSHLLEAFEIEEDDWANLISGKAS